MPVGLPPILSLYFDLFDGLIQAVVFTFLSTVYIAEAIE
jgi:F-type H+-transporting ATPase subunit a